jgi:hypothetical protein
MRRGRRQLPCKWSPGGGAREIHTVLCGAAPTAYPGVQQVSAVHHHPCDTVLVGSLKMNTALEYSTRVVQEGDRRCKKSTLTDLAYLTPLRIPLMNPVYVSMPCCDVQSHVTNFQEPDFLSQIISDLTKLKFSLQKKLSRRLSWTALSLFAGPDAGRIGWSRPSGRGGPPTQYTPMLISMPKWR